ncbi:MAG: neutral/alkaline non-lysosomal ceramidase N-terminal domain-containing protein [Chloroflexota bacterium]|nr:neutral/alkaline non-lysosomal ceramidase N-terminal domain-containing protein [Chloroflexota bacterium]
MTFRAGAAEVVTTPPIGTPLDGYGGREGGATGVHDDLHARALVVDDGDAQAAIVSVDLVGIDRRLVASIRERASAATGIPAANMMIAATHTHAGPAGLRRDLDEPLTEMMARTISRAIVAADRDLRPSVLKVGRGSVDSVSQNRRDPGGPFDDALRVLLFDSPDPREQPIASVLNFACHPTVLYGTNMLISADYPGYALRTVKQVLGDAPVLFLNGACGDVNPAWIEQRHEDAYRVGSIVGSEAARRLQELRPLGNQHKVWTIRWDELADKPVASGELIESPHIRVVNSNAAVPLRRLEPPAVYEERMANLGRQRDSVGPNDVEGMRRVMEQIIRYRTERTLAERLGPSEQRHYAHPELQVISFGDGCAVLGLPGEFFVETGRAIREAAGLRNLFVACYANHYVGYLVPKHSFDEGGYEPGVAMLDETAEETLRLTAIDMLREISA